jgi:hypothetical protein
MPAVLFEYHRNRSQPTLTVETGANEIAWSYGLNTQTYPTYAGEVVQILSTYIDTLTITGEVRSYAKMEEIYRWFLFYIQDATQGGRSEEPVYMKYPHRGWTLTIQPIQLPGLRYGRDVVIPTWQMQAHVIDPDPEQAELTIDAAMNPEMANFRTLTADIGFRQANPFSDPLGVLNEEEKKLGIDGPSRQQISDELDGIAKRLSDNLEEYTSQDFGSIFEMYGIETASKPSDSKGDKDEADQTKEKKK